ncbi:MAG: hypothetical protein MZU91_05580 [Desulfosudis oleivorans]|nr:hypothetical protein [Desulfosudis oleivorans]
MGNEPGIDNLVDSMMDVGGAKYLFMSHDEIGNNGGARLITKLIAEKIGIWDKLTPLPNESKPEHGIRGFDVVNRLAKEYLYNRENWDNSEKYNKLIKDLKLNEGSLQKKQIEDSINEALALHKVGIGTLFMAPGSKMIFQGDEYGELSPFRFMRRQAFDEPEQLKEKGYDLQEAFYASKLNPEQNKNQGIAKFSIAMSDLMRRNPTLQDTQPIDKLFEMFIVRDDENKVLGIKRFNFEGNEVIALANFGDNMLNEYKVDFPSGNWQDPSTVTIKNMAEMVYY